MVHDHLVPTGSDANHPRSTAVEAAVAEDLVRRLQAVRKKKDRHLFWAVVGITPAALIPAVGLLMEGNTGLVVVLLVLVLLGQAYGWVKAVLEAKELEEAIRQLPDRS